MSPESNNWLAALFRDHSRALLRFVSTRSADAVDAEDIAQEAWLRLQRVRSPEQLDNPRAFLFQTAANLAIDKQRRQRVEARYLAQEAVLHQAITPGTPTTEHHVQMQTDLRDVMQAIDELPSNCRQAFLMHRGRGMSYPEIARALGVSTSMVEKHVINALKHCRKRIQRDD